jgi:hypothetical protein
LFRLQEENGVLVAAAREAGFSDRKSRHEEPRLRAQQDLSRLTPSRKRGVA